MSELLAIVSDIQRAGLHDGPGTRTTVFFKGCPLRCQWCHNPECISPKPQELFYPEKCIGCGKCAEGCFAGARVPCGKEMTQEELLLEILPDKAYYGEKGGVTFSGGEPLMQASFVAAFADLLHSNGIGTAMETCLWYFDAAALSRMDYIMADLKLWDSDLHERYTGRPNGPILEHFRELDRLGIPFLVRTPVVGGVNDNAENIKRTAEFVSGLKNAVGYELLRYHSLGIPKKTALGEQPVLFEAPSKERMEELRGYADIH